MFLLLFAGLSGSRAFRVTSVTGIILSRFQDSFSHTYYFWDGSTWVQMGPE
jgi:hypothetical protein